eukprot:1621729-Prymnesium_polylepis.1
MLPTFVCDEVQVIDTPFEPIDMATGWRNCPRLQRTSVVCRGPLSWKIDVTQTARPTRPTTAIP